MPPRLIGRDLQTASSSAKLRILLHPLQLRHSPEASNLESRANEAIAALNRIAMSGTYVNTRCIDKKKNHFAKRGKIKHESLSMDQHEFSKTAGNKGNEECVKTVTLDQATITVSNAEQQLNTDTWDDELNANSSLNADSANSSIRTTIPTTTRSGAKLRQPSATAPAKHRQKL